MQDVSALVLLSGGLDSVTALAWAMRQNYALRGAVSFTYGQRHVREITAAAAIAAFYGLPHHVIALPPIQGSALTDTGIPPQGRDVATVRETVAPTYVPNRNMIFLAQAAAYGLHTDITHLIGGWNATDAQNYPDCREAFLAAMQQTLYLATERVFTIVRPLIQADKATIVRQALAFDAPVAHTWTCYLGAAQACGTCDACQLRIQAFQQCGYIDPIAYANTIDWHQCRPYQRV